MHPLKRGDVPRAPGPTVIVTARRHGHPSVPGGGLLRRPSAHDPPQLVRSGGAVPPAASKAWVSRWSASRKAPLQSSAKRSWAGPVHGVPCSTDETWASTALIGSICRFSVVPRWSESAPGIAPHRHRSLHRWTSIPPPPPEGRERVPETATRVGKAAVDQRGEGHAVGADTNSRREAGSHLGWSAAARPRRPRRR